MFNKFNCPGDKKSKIGGIMIHHLCEQLAVKSNLNDFHGSFPLAASVLRQEDIRQRSLGCEGSSEYPQRLHSNTQEKQNSVKRTVVPNPKEKEHFYTHDSMCNIFAQPYNQAVHACNRRQHITRMDHRAMDIQTKWTSRLFHAPLPCRSSLSSPAACSGP